MSGGVLIVGASLAGLVAATELAEAGRAVTLVNPGGPWGGYFAGLDVDGFTFDAGMIALEFTAFAAQADRGRVADYDPGVRNDIGRFAGVVGEWVNARFRTRLLEPLTMRIEGETLPDLIMGNALEALPRLPFAAQAREDLHGLPDAGDLHASRKAQGAAYDTASFEAASLANHGIVLHERLVQPFLRKVFGRHAGGLLARYHRIPWIPLYWPETLRRVLEGEPPPIEASPLHYPQGSSVAGMTAQLVAALDASPHVTMLNGRPVSVAGGRGDWKVGLEDGRTLAATHLAWTHAPAALVEALGHVPSRAAVARAPLALGMFGVAADAVRERFSVLGVVDETVATYRVTDLSTCAGVDEPVRRWVVEFNLEVFEAMYGAGSSDAAVLDALERELVTLDLADAAGIRPLGFKRVPGGFAVADAPSFEAWRADRAVIDAQAPGLELMAAGSGFMVTSLADQVIQGLKFADDLMAVVRAD